MIRRSDGSKWRVPTAFYEPDKEGVDQQAMRDYVALRHCVSRTNDVVALQEAGAGEEHSTRVLFIRGDSARLYSIYGTTRELQLSEPLPGLTGELQAVSRSGITLSGHFFAWEELKLLSVREFNVDK